MKGVLQCSKIKITSNTLRYYELVRVNLRCLHLNMIFFMSDLKDQINNLIGLGRAACQEK